MGELISDTRSTQVTVDMAADIGESFGDYRIGDDDQLLPHLTSANIACGFHAGDPRTMERAVRQCTERGVAIGAHPGFPDRVGFGRRAMEMTADEVRTDVLYQIGALSAFARACGTRIKHMSPHGRLGNLVVTDDHYAQAVLGAVEEYDSGLVILTSPGKLERLARDREVGVALMGFPDRAYEDDGTLVSRKEPGAVFTAPEEIVERALSIVVDGMITSRHGTTVETHVDSILLHGDNVASIASAGEIRRGLERAGVRLAPLHDVLAARLRSPASPR